MPLPLDTFDCAVIGAGVVGLTVAEELLSHGLSVCLVDRQEPGREASWAGAGVLPPGSRYSDDPRLEALAKLSHPLNAALSEKIRTTTGLDDGYWQCGGLYLASNAAEAEQLESMALRWEAADVETPRRPSEEVRAMLPLVPQQTIQFAQDHAAFFMPAEAQLRNPRRLKGLVQLCKSLGGRLIANDAVTDLVESSSGVELRLQTGECIQADRVCVAAGAWSQALLPEVKGRPNVRPIRGQMLLLESPDGHRSLNHNVHIDHFYAAPRKDGRVLVGSTVEDVGFDKSTTAEACGELLRFANLLGLGGLKLADSWAGLRPASSDGLPMIGPTPGSKRVLLATGHFRAGLQFAPATARLIREIMLGQPTTLDTTPFRIDR